MTMKRIVFLLSMVAVTLAISIPGIPGRSAASGFGIPKVGDLDVKGAAEKFMNVAAKGSGIPDIGDSFDVKGAADKFMKIAGEGPGIPNLDSNTNSQGEDPKEKLQNAMKYSKDAMKVINAMKSYKGKSNINVKRSQSSKDNGEDEHKHEPKTQDRKSRKNEKNGGSKDYEPPPY